MKLLFTSLLVLCLFSLDISACTTFCLKNKNEVLFGKNYDWMIGDGLIFVNKRGVSKVSSEDVNPAKWTSKYGSVTFNQYGWESPSGGMNEAGLVIELMWLDDTQYPTADERPSIDVLEWIQFNLDTASTAEEVVHNANTVRIASAVKLHYLVNDRSGNSATIEFLDGKLVSHSGDRLPVPTLANDTYQKSLEYSKGATSTTTESSLDRYSRAAKRTRSFSSTSRKEKEAVDYAFDILSEVRQENSTQWSIVYDQRRGRIYFRTKKHADLKSIDTTSFDYSCGTRIKIFDIDTTESGDVTHRFRPYTRKENRELIGRSFRSTPFLKNVPDPALDKLAEFPEIFSCSANSPVTRPVDTKSLIASGEFARYLFIGVPLYYVYALVSS